jgi:hypothetical protein
MIVVGSREGQAKRVDGQVDVRPRGFLLHFLLALPQSTVLISNAILGTGPLGDGIHLQAEALLLPFFHDLPPLLGWVGSSQLLSFEGEKGALGEFELSVGSGDHEGTVAHRFLLLQ